ncbi:phosphoribosylformimino-5-aminoimidazole carboxamide ribotide isomerase [Marispirochaeta aestuarii]|uniref:Phosphoribosylformimino-5-aminoimidazole carboxamide ribotide isomerase n=1 Tax=Marispirochaeta aestuarii TaxID=1963862 RepID=A0A1Y1RWY1_9SPIO|nr:phosphoribosylformimino-5-aminoimidazole carboxamide ribotide isomerase [Marispirochaeta aestuarii]ORC34828.1 phosphoribosylformimino-5-aminoimidazole carboxamide ribotide isomerase [Marispirochaeta aestuarii]
MRFRPCIDLHQGKVKQIIGGTLSDDGAQENFVSPRDAAWYADLYKRYRLAGGHVIMLGPGNTEEALKALKAYPGGLQVGGGIDPENAGMFLDAGAMGVIVTSWVFREGRIDFERLEAMKKKVGRERLILDLSCRLKDGSYWIVTDRWSRFTLTPLNAETLEQLGDSCGEFLVHAADVEGKQQGIEDPVAALLGEASPVPATYAGGIRNLEDIDLVRSLGKGRVDFTVGSALDIFGGSLPFSSLAAEYA